MIELNRHWMKMAIAEAQAAAAKDEVPVGAIIVRDGVIIGRGHNLNRSLGDPTAHAEMIAITAACETVKDSRLKNAELYVTLEPCAMCAGAIVLARISKLHYGAADMNAGACGSVLDIVRDRRLNHQVEVYGGIERDECARILSEFFEQKSR